MACNLSAILAADVVGYSNLMEKDEAGTLDVLKNHRRDIFDPQIARHGGRVVKLIVPLRLTQVRRPMGCAL